MKADSMGSFANDYIASQQILDFPDNRLLIDLCGEYDKHLAELEQKLTVQIIRRGNELAVHGTSEAVRVASAVLNELYQRLEGGRDVDVGHFDRAMRVLNNDQGFNTTPENQLEMFGDGEIEMKTRKKSVEPQTPAQKDFVRALHCHE